MISVETQDFASPDSQLENSTFCGRLRQLRHIRVKSPHPEAELILMESYNR